MKPPAANTKVSGKRERRLARAILSLADTAGMPDSFWQTDQRVAVAREVLGVPDDGRYSQAHLWELGLDTEDRPK